MPIWEKPYLRGSERRKLGFWEEVRFGAKSSSLVQDIARRKEEEGLGLQVQRDSRYEKPNPNPFLLVFRFNKTLNVLLNCSWMVLVQFEVVLHSFD